MPNWLWRFGLFSSSGRQTPSEKEAMLGLLLLGVAARLAPANIGELALTD